MTEQGIVSCGITEHAVGITKAVRHLRSLGCGLPVEFHSEVRLPPWFIGLDKHFFDVTHKGHSSETPCSGVDYE